MSKADEVTEETLAAGGRVGRAQGEVPLALDPSTFRALGHRLVDRIAELLESIPDRPVRPDVDPVSVRERLRWSDLVPVSGKAPEALLEEAVDLLADHSLFNGHPRFFGYITSSPAPIGMLGDLLASAVNANVGAWTLSPMASEIEGQTVRWIADLLGYPREAGGLLVSGGNMANLVGFWAARAAAGRAWSLRATGMGAGEGPRLRAYVSAETHTWVQKAADLAGLGTDAVRWIDTDAHQRLDMAALRDAVAADRKEGAVPMMVVGTAGSVSTGAVDPLAELADFCEAEKIWLHVDGAYGAFAALVPEAAPDLAHLGRADSLAVDPHKWLYAPLEAGCALVRRPEDLRAAFAYHPPYYQFGVEATNYVDWGPQNSRGFRALKVWLALRQAGRDGYARMIRDDIALTGRLHRRVHEHPELEAMTLGLSISCFRYVPKELGTSAEDAAHPATGEGRGREEHEDYLNRLNRELRDRLEHGGEAFLSNAVIGRRYALRACIVNFNTTRADVDALPEIVARYGRAVHAERGEGGQVGTG